MANRPITITGINPSDNSLILSDNGNTTANRGDTITWNIGNNSGVASITGIISNKSEVDIFSPDPTVQANSTSWQGQVSNTIAVLVTEYYTIAYTRSGSNEAQSYDPKIQVNT